MNSFVNRCIFYHKAMHLAPYHFVPEDMENCPYMNRSFCPIWNCVFHYENFWPKALYVKTCNYKNLVR